ncbi:MAG: amino acid permease [Bacteroidales bacterium]
MLKKIDSHNKKHPIIMENDNNEGLKREIGVVGLASNAINSIVGGGIFVLPALVAGIMGSTAIITYLICGVAVILITLCFAEIGSKVTVSGGAYAYVEAAFGTFAGFLTNTLFWFGFGVLSDAAIATAMAGMLAITFPIFKLPPFRALFFLVMYGGFAIVNIRGVKQGINMVKVNTLIKLVPLIILITYGWVGVSTKNLQWSQIPSFKNIGEASLILFFAFAGGEMALNNSGEILNPMRTVPIGLILGIGTVVVLYVLIQTISLGVLGSELAVNKQAPLAAVAEKLMGGFGSVLMISGAVISIFGALSGSVLSYPRLLFAGSRNGFLPAFLAKVHPKFATPYWAICTYTLLVLIFSITGGFRQLVIVSSASLLLIYMAVVLSTIKLRLRKDPSPPRTFKIPGGITIPSITLILIIWFLSRLTRNEVTGIALMILVLTVIYLIMKLIKNKTVFYPKNKFP